MTAKAQKFQFGTIFESEHMALNDPSYSHLQMEELTSNHFQKGFEEGKTCAQKGIDALNAQHLQHVHSELANILSVQQEMFTALEESVSSVCRIITRKLLPVMAGKHALDEIMGVVDTAFKAHQHGNVLKVFVSPEYCEALKSKLQEKVGELEGTNFEVIADEALVMADCRIEWETGGLERLTQHVHQQIETALDRLTASADFHKQEMQKESTRNPETDISENEDPQL